MCRFACGVLHHFHRTLDGSILSFDVWSWIRKLVPPFEADLGAFFDDVRRWVGRRKALTIILKGFLTFLAFLGGSEEVSEASWGLSWTISEHFRTCWREDGEQEGQDGDQEGQHSDQERQDEPA